MLCLSSVLFPRPRSVVGVFVQIFVEEVNPELWNVRLRNPCRTFSGSQSPMWIRRRSKNWVPSPLYYLVLFLYKLHITKFDDPNPHWTIRRYVSIMSITTRQMDGTLSWWWVIDFLIFIWSVWSPPFPYLLGVRPVVSHLFPLE